MTKVAEIISRIDAIESKLDCLLNLLQVKPKEPCCYTLYSWLDEFYTVYKVPKLKPSSLSQMRNVIANHIKKHLDNKPLDELTALEIQKAINDVKTSRTRRYVYIVLGSACRQAVKLGIITANPMLAVESPKHTYKLGKALTREQQDHFVAIIAKNKLRALYVFYLLSGCRRNEATALTWDDVDYKNRLLHIGGTKTAKSDRTIPLFPPLERLLSALPHRSEKIFDATPNAVKCNFRRLKVQHSLPYRLHDLRHTFATRCLENGIAMKTIQKWLGHSRLETTANIYTEVLSNFELEEVEKYDPHIPI